MKIALGIVLALLISKPVAAETYYFVGANFPSISEQSDKGHIEGLGVDIAERIVHRLGHQIKIQLLPFKRALYMIETGTADAIIGPYKSKQREKYITYSQLAFYEDALVFYLKKDNHFQWDGQFSSLVGKDIGLTRGWSYGTQFDQFKGQLNTFEVNSVTANFKKLLLGRIELFACHPRAASKVINQLDIAEQIKMASPPIMINRGYFGFSKKRNLDGFINQFNSEFKKMIANNEMLQLNKQYNLQFIDRSN